MLKKLYLILCGVLIAIDSFATTDIAANAENSTCDSGVLGTTEGDVNFDAKWAANNVPLIWHDNHTVIQTAQNTCEYDGTLTIPTPEPQRVGYTFAGWHVMPTVDASELTSLSTGSERWGVGISSYNGKVCYHASGTADSTKVNCKSYDQFGELERNEWKVEYRSGTLRGSLYGSAYCNGKSGNNSTYTWPTATSSSWLATHAKLEAASGEKKYCWCQATGWLAEGSSTLQALSSLSSAQTWVFLDNYGSADDCAIVCAGQCTKRASRNSVFRSALFVGAGN